MQDREIKGDPDIALKEMKYAALGKMQKVLGAETIDPEYVIGAQAGAVVNRDELLSEVLTLEALTRKLSASDMSRLSVARFPKKRFYNRNNFARDWSDPEANQYLTTLEHLE